MDLFIGGNRKLPAVASKEERLRAIFGITSLSTFSEDIIRFIN